jgi:hypothetical protein
MSHTPTTSNDSIRTTRRTVLRGAAVGAGMLAFGGVTTRAFAGRAAAAPSATETLYLADSGGDNAGDFLGRLFAVDLDDSFSPPRANLTLLREYTNPNFGRTAAIAASADGATIYMVDAISNHLGSYDVASGDFDDLGEVSGLPSGVVLASFSLDGTLYVASQDDDTLYAVDPSGLSASPFVTVSGADVLGADIAFDSTGTLYLYSSGSQELFTIDYDENSPTFGQATLVGFTGDFFTGLAVRAAGTGDLVGSNTNRDEVVVVDKATGAQETAFEMYLDGKRYAYGFGDMTVGSLVNRSNCVDLGAFEAGTPIEGANKLYDGLTITSDSQNAVTQRPGVQPASYGAPNGGGGPNGCMSPLGGFADVDSKVDKNAQNFTFAFDSPVSSFKLRMLDFGDFNPTRATRHYARMDALDATNSVVATQELEYTSSGGINPTSWTPVTGTAKTNASLQQAGDACDAAPGEPGRYTWSVAGAGIQTVELSFGEGFDPNVAFDTLCFVEEECAFCDEEGLLAKYEFACVEVDPDDEEGCVAYDFVLDGDANENISYTAGNFRADEDGEPSSMTVGTGYCSVWTVTKAGQDFLVAELTAEDGDVTVTNEGSDHAISFVAFFCTEEAAVAFAENFPSNGKGGGNGGGEGAGKGKGDGESEAESSDEDADQSGGKGRKAGGKGEDKRNDRAAGKGGRK